MFLEPYAKEYCWDELIQVTSISSVFVGVVRWGWCGGGWGVSGKDRLNGGGADVRRLKALEVAGQSRRHFFKQFHYHFSGKVVRIHQLISCWK